MISSPDLLHVLSDRPLRRLLATVSSENFMVHSTSIFEDSFYLRALTRDRSLISCSGYLCSNGLV
jgi:hypothetical protein